MNQILEILHKKNCETRDALCELDRRTSYAKEVMQEVYSKRTDELKKKQRIISALLAEGDFDAAMLKLAEVDSLMKQSPDIEIKQRLSEYNLHEGK